MYRIISHIPPTRRKPSFEFQVGRFHVSESPSSSKLSKMALSAERARAEAVAAALMAADGEGEGTLSSEGGTPVSRGGEEAAPAALAMPYSTVSLRPSPENPPINTPLQDQRRNLRVTFVPQESDGKKDPENGAEARLACTFPRLRSHEAPEILGQPLTVKGSSFLTHVSAENPVVPSADQLGSAHLEPQPGVQGILHGPSTPESCACNGSELTFRMFLPDDASSASAASSTAAAEAGGSTGDRRGEAKAASIHYRDKGKDVQHRGRFTIVKV